MVPTVMEFEVTPGAGLVAAPAPPAMPPTETSAAARAAPAIATLAPIPVPYLFRMRSPVTVAVPSRPHEAPFSMHQSPLIPLIQEQSLAVEFPQGADLAHVDRIKLVDG